MSLHGCAAHLIPPPSRLRVFGWLLREKKTERQPSKALSYFITLIFFVVQFATPK
jgi:hypothetical protein